METLTIQPWSDTLAEGRTTFPDFLIHRMAAAGVGVIEADLAVGVQDVAWRYVPHRHGRRRCLRPFPPSGSGRICLGWATFAKADPYASHRLFAVHQHPEWPRQAIHRFSLFLCNEPAMGYWFILYLYCIDGVWPMPRPGGTSGTADAGH